MANQVDSHMERRKGCRVVLFPLPFQGHISPAMQLANILYSEGFSITIIHTNFNSPNPSNFPHFAFHFISENISKSEASMADLVTIVQLLNARCKVPFRDCLARLLSDASDDGPIACLISDGVFHSTQAVADELKLPRMALWTSGATSLHAFASFPLLREKGYLPIQDSRLEEPVPELPPLRVKDLPVLDTSKQEDVDQLVADMINGTKGSSGLIWNTFEELESSALSKMGQEFGIPIYPIGPLHKRFPASSSSLLPQDQSCISWLDKQEPRSVIYVSFGSVASINETQFLEIAWGLAESKQPFLWVVRPGLIQGSDWLEPLPEGFLESLGGRGHIVKWAPQQEVLAHPAVGVFWTHSGWNSTIESICEGVPMICMPSFADQMVNARYVCEVWRSGVQVEKELERGEIEQTIKRLMVDKEREDIRKSILLLKEKANQCLSQDGSSSQSLDSLICQILSTFCKLN